MNGIEFKANGTPYTLKMGTLAMARYERASGESIIDGLTKLETNPSILTILGLFRAALSETLTEEEAADVIDELGFAHAVDLLGKAAARSFTPDKEPEENPKKPSKKTR